MRDHLLQTHRKRGLDVDGQQSTAINLFPITISEMRFNKHFFILITVIRAAVDVVQVVNAVAIAVEVDVDTVRV